MDLTPNPTTPGKAQTVTLPLIVNGRGTPMTGTCSSSPQVERDGCRGSPGAPARFPARLHDRFTDATGRLLAFSDDCEDLGGGTRITRILTSWSGCSPTATLHIGDTARKGGEEYAYRLRLSAPQPDFALRVVPSSVALRSKSTAAINVHLIRKDGFTGPIGLALKDPPVGFSASPLTLSGTQTVARLTVRSSLVATEEPVSLSVVGSAKIGEKEIIREAVPAEDRMAFLWRHLVPPAI